jgi:hypothetical protein
MTPVQAMTLGNTTSLSANGYSTIGPVAHTCARSSAGPPPSGAGARTASVSSATGRATRRPRRFRRRSRALEARRRPAARRSTAAPR